VLSVLPCLETWLDEVSYEKRRHAPSASLYAGARCATLCNTVFCGILCLGLLLLLLLAAAAALCAL
jgi:hypothetical protein